MLLCILLAQHFNLRSINLSLLTTYLDGTFKSALVTADDVRAVFDLIVEGVPDSLDLNPLLGYYERTWIVGMNGRHARYPLASWNQTDRVEKEMGRTNVCEVFNEIFS